MRRLAVFFVFFMAAIGGIAYAAGGFDLITEKEAASKDMRNPVYFDISRTEGGPSIEVLSPEAGKSYQSPINIKVKFAPEKGFDIDLATFKLEYMKFIAIDLTSRVKDYVSKDGIDVPDAKLPSGKHTIRMSVGDANGVVTKRIFTVEVL
ncbi:MAG: hypothetical protein WA162_04045 [Thermodesulfobacteriota bacterium]